MAKRSMSELSDNERLQLLIEHLDALKRVYQAQQDTFKKTGDPLSLAISLGEKAVEVVSLREWVDLQLGTAFGARSLQSFPPKPPLSEKAWFLSRLSEVVVGLSKLDAAAKGVPYLEPLERITIEMSHRVLSQMLEWLKPRFKDERGL